MSDSEMIDCYEIQDDYQEKDDYSCQEMEQEDK